MKKKILFISHEASRTGAPIVLLHFLRWLKANTEIPFAVLIRESRDAMGELLADFEAVAPVSLLNGERSSFNGFLTRSLRVGRRTVTGTASVYDDVAKWIRRNDVSIVYSNTITNGPLLEPLAALGYPVITHVHELEFSVQHIVGLESFRRLVKGTQHYIAASQAVQRNLVENHAIAPEKIDVVYEFVPTSNDKQNANLDQQKAGLREKMHIPQNALVIGASGTTDWRKGPDIFIHVARAIARQEIARPIYFLWIGGKNDGRQFAELWHDVTCLGLEKYVRFTGTVPNPLDYLSLVDIFILPSREDAFPLVCLEAASLGKPIICFDGAGGAKEFVEEDAGFVVPYLDIGSMVSKLLELSHDPVLRGEMGKRGLQKVRERHDISVAAPRLLKIIEDFFDDACRI